jgi:acyl-[acyl-carrier-protein]-phospholipid O-acyltransferase/long-chain-fatty-acid--[acyl-carrier-protein] ligase
MLLHQHFVKIAKRYGQKVAFIDRTSDKKLTYSKALIASLIFAEKIRQHEEGFIGIMIPTSAGCALAVLGTLMSGKTPVMINYSTGAAVNVYTPRRNAISRRSSHRRRCSKKSTARSSKAWCSSKM